MLLGKTYDEKADVFSYGIILYNLFSRWVGCWLGCGGGLLLAVGLTGWDLQVPPAFHNVLIQCTANVLQSPMVSMLIKLQPGATVRRPCRNIPTLHIVLNGTFEDLEAYAFTVSVAKHR